MVNGKFEDTDAYMVIGTGISYKGPVSGGYPNGDGILNTSDKSYSYEGHWLNGKMNGEGI